MNPSDTITHFVHSACCGGHWVVEHDVALACVSAYCEKCGKPGLSIDDAPDGVEHCCNGIIEIAYGRGIVYLLCDSCMEPLLLAPDKHGTFRDAGSEPVP